MAFRVCVRLSLGWTWDSVAFDLFGRTKDLNGSGEPDCFSVLILLLRRNRLLLNVNLSDMVCSIRFL